MMIANRCMAGVCTSRVGGARRIPAGIAAIVGPAVALAARVPGRQHRRPMRRLSVLLALVLATLAPVSPVRAFSGRAEEIRIVEVIDGDSLRVMAGKRRLEVRLADVDAPEARQSYGRSAAALARRLALGQRGHMRSRARDAYGRIVADVYLSDGRSLGHLLVAAGLAWHDPRFRAKPNLAALQESARRARRGLWEEPRPVPPWDYRRRHRRRSGK
jgi:endonuclease YncB( thermonuclease family)